MTDAAAPETVDPTRLVDVLAAVKRARDTGKAGLPFSVYVMPAITVNGLESFTEFHSLESGIDADVTMGRYNVLHQDLMNDASPLHAAKPQLLVLALAWDVVVPDSGVGAGDVIARLKQLFQLAAERAKCPVAVNTFPIPGDLYDRGADDASPANRVSAVNDWIRAFVRAHPSDFFLCDWEAYLRDIGAEQALDDRYWFMAKAPFKPPFLSRYGADIAKIARALLGLNKKVLILDCDNTLWGGVLGEDGLDGIHLHTDDYPGNVFSAVQKLILELPKRGVLLAVCSKNNEADVIEAMTSHPYALLRPENFVAMKVNWENKADNIRAMAQELNLGLDSMVFIDDSPFEIEMVRTQLPQVTALQVPKNLFRYPRYIQEIVDRYFYAAAMTEEDARRTEMYQAREQAGAEMAAFSDTESYLRSLEITLDCHALRESEVPRVSQLTAKTNQFNVRKHPYGEAEIRGAIESNERAIYVGEVADKFGKLGLTVVCIIDKVSDTQATVDSFLMSCRVFERNIEYSFMAKVFSDLRKHWDIDTVSASWVRTDKNEVCRDFFANAGMSLVKEDDDELSFEMDLKAYEPVSYDYIAQI